MTNSWDMRWGYQFLWTAYCRRWYISSKELTVVWLVLYCRVSFRKRVCFWKGNKVVAHCINSQGFSRSPSLLRPLEQIFCLSQRINPLHYSLLHSWSQEQLGGHTLLSTSNLSGVVPLPESVPVPGGKVGLARHGPVCSSIQCQVFLLPQQDNSDSHMDARCLQSGLEQVGLCLPAPTIVHKSPPLSLHSPPVIPGSSSSGGASVEDMVMVP